jgi:hypothetical protein
MRPLPAFPPLLLAALLAAPAAAALAQDAAPATAPRDATVEAPIAPKLQHPDAAAADTAPSVRISTGENGDRIEEYRVNGRLTMVKITPLRGPAYWLHDTDGDGRLDGSDRSQPVAPVYWTLFEWN